ncbi:MAG: transposase [Candidatus Omnitrophota bacterium]|nr:MAG: transposase [Candidatus Omnitrophota bacterium]
MKEYKTRKQIRLKEYDYSLNGYYFITMCSYNRENIFGEIPVGADGCRPDNNTKIILNEYGLIVEEELKNTENIRQEIKLDRYAIMPNHVHCIIIIQRQLSGGQPAAPTGQTLSSFVSGFKSVATKRINILRDTSAKPVWQRSFYDHIIRNDRSLNAIREYISNNPFNWEQDIDNLINL